MKWLAAGLVLISAACASAPEPQKTSEAQSVTRHTPRADGTSIEWHMTGRTGAAKQGVLLLSQGSGCGPAATNPNLPTWRVVAPEFVAVTVEKYGVSASDPTLAEAGVGQMDACPDAHVKGHRLYGRVADFEAVIAELRKEKWWSGDVVLMGGSEGGAVMSVLAPRVPEADAVVILSTGVGWPLSRIILESLPPEARPQLAGMFDAIRANPESDMTFSGLSAAYYAEFMDRKLVEELVATDAPVLVVFGEKDQWGPVESARTMQDAFAAAGKSNLTYREKTGLDHGMIDVDGVSHIDDVLAEIATWVGQRLGR